MLNWKYLALLVAVIGAAIGYVYAGSEVRTIHVTGKYVKDGAGRRGLPTERLIVETKDGAMPILKFPILGYTFGANDAYTRLPSEGEARVRIGHWPPAIVSKYSKPHILRVYDMGDGKEAVERKEEGSSPSRSRTVLVHLIPLGDQTLAAD